MNPYLPIRKVPLDYNGIESSAYSVQMQHPNEKIADNDQVRVNGFGELLDAEWKETLQRNVDHLETIKAYKKEDGTTSIWGSENFTAIDAAITSGKSKIAAL